MRSNTHPGAAAPSPWERALRAAASGLTLDAPGGLHGPSATEVAASHAAWRCAQRRS